MPRARLIFDRCWWLESRQESISRIFRLNFNPNSCLSFREGTSVCKVFSTAQWTDDISYRFGTKRVRANQVYQEYIADKSHLHMNATRWVTLTEFVKHLGRTGVGRVDETEKGWFIAWIDSSPKALAKAVCTETIIHSLNNHDSMTSIYFSRRLL